MDDKVIQELNKARREIAAELAAIDATLEILKKRVAGDGQAPLLSEAQSSEAVQPSITPTQEDEGPTSNGRPVRKIKLTQEVRKAIQEVEEPFTQQDITRRITEKYPDASVSPPVVSNALARMVKREEGIELIASGYGSEPNVYRRVPLDARTQVAITNSEAVSDEEDVMDEEHITDDEGPESG